MTVKSYRIGFPKSAQDAINAFVLLLPLQPYALAGV
jgi:hypothetical protein